MTNIIQFDRSKFQGFKFDFVLNGQYGKFLAITETPEQAIQEYIEFYNVKPTECRQLSKYPTRL
jgi:hypothetical protein